MAVYWITFRIAEKTINQRSYEERYEALQAAILGRAGTCWSEPTSFVAFDSPQSIDQIATACKAAIAPSADLFLIRQMDTKAARICGANADRDIFKLMPYLKQI